MIPNNPGEQAAEPLNIEHVMQEVRREILERKLPGQVRLPEAAASSQRPEYYEELFRAALAQSRNEVDLLVTPTRTPLIGPVVDFIRRKFHELVVFYINRAAMNQAKVNHHILAALSILGQADPAARYAPLSGPESGARAGLDQGDAVTMEDIRAGYRLFFGADTEAGDLDYWANLIATERITRAHLIESFMSSYNAQTQPIQPAAPEDVPAVSPAK